MYKETLGIVGGFGAYATLNFYKRIIEIFASGSERDYPHILMDNNFTMPSRTRALLYGECYDEIVCEIAKSLKRLIQQGADKIVLVCGTAHYFLPDVYLKIPEASEYVIDMIDVLGEKMQAANKQEAVVVAAEGTLLKELYPKRLGDYGITCISPDETTYQEIRFFIEAVKRNEIDRNVLERYHIFLQNYPTKEVILGCTEFPVLNDYAIERSKDISEYVWIHEYTFWDPLELVLEKLKKELS